MSRFMRTSSKGAFCLFVTCLALAARAGYEADIDAVAKQAEPWPAEIVIRQTNAASKEMYRQTAEVFLAGIRSITEYMVKQPKPYPNIGFYIGNALWLARQYSLTEDEAYARTVALCLDHAHRLIAEPPPDQRNTVPSWDTVRDLYWIDAWLKKSPAYTETHRQFVRDIAVRACPSFPASAEYGVHNRTAGAALAGQCLIALVPDAPDAAKWKTYADTVWGQFWTARDTEESTDHYTGLWFRYLLDWIQIRGVDKEFWSDPGVKRMMERFLYQAFPMGSLPHYSDTCGWNVSWGHWVFIFESCATAYKDGRYKWAAHRIYDYGIDRIEKLSSWGYTGEEAGWSLLKASIVADDSIPERPREKDVALLIRHKAIQRTEADRVKSGQFLDLLQEMVPDKLVFNSGSDRDGLSMMVDVVGDAGHSHARRPTILALADHQSVLLMGLGYMDRNPEDHDIPQVIDYDGYPYDNTPYHIKSTNNLVLEVRSYDLGPAGYASARIGNYMGYPATLTREFMFVKNVGVVVKDTIEFAVDLKLRWGSLYRVRNLGPDYGENWANTYLGEWIPLRSLGKNAPVLTRWRNSPRDLLICYAPDPQAKLEVVDESAADKTCPLPLRLEYTFRQKVTPDSPVTTTTLLLPHAPGPAKDLAARARFLLNEPKRTVMEFADPTGATHVIVFNRSGQQLKAGGVTTDGSAAYVCKRGGKIAAAGLLEGKTLRCGWRSVSRLAPVPQANVVPSDGGDTVPP